MYTFAAVSMKGSRNSRQPSANARANNIYDDAQPSYHTNTSTDPNNMLRVS
jgi:hypothetical protein